MTYKESSEQNNFYQLALDATKQVIDDSIKLEALRKGVGRYTRNVDVEFRGIDDVLNSENTQVFNEHRGVAYMLWGVIVGMLQRDGQVTLADLSEGTLSEVIYQAYSNSGASGW